MSKKQLLVIAHTPSENTNEMLIAVLDGATNSELSNIELRYIEPFKAQPEDVMSAHAIILGTPENLGYMSGALKDFFDRCYYPCLEKTQGMPFAFFIRAGHDGTGTRRAIESITTGLAWKQVQEPLICQGEFDVKFLGQCKELGLAMAASLDAGII